MIVDVVSAKEDLSGLDPLWWDYKRHALLSHVIRKLQIKPLIGRRAIVEYYEKDNQGKRLILKNQNGKYSFFFRGILYTSYY